MENVPKTDQEILLMFRELTRIRYAYKSLRELFAATIKSMDNRLAIPKSDLIEVNKDDVIASYEDPKNNFIVFELVKIQVKDK